MRTTELLGIATALCPDKESIVFEGKRYTYSQTSERVNRLANALIGLGVKTGDRVAVLHKGKIRFVGTIPEMLDQVRGKVWEVEATTGELAGLRDKYLETALRREGSKIHIRLAAEKLDHLNAKPVEPSLEDAYLWLMREDANAGK